MSVGDGRRAGPQISLINGGSEEDEGNVESDVKRRVPVYLLVMADTLAHQFYNYTSTTVSEKGDFARGVKRRVLGYLSVMADTLGHRYQRWL